MPEEFDEPGFDDSLLPPADFSFLVNSLLFQAQMEMGLLRLGPDEENPEPNLVRARHVIDLLGVVEEKTRGNLSLEEQRLLENGLTELRFRYVQMSNETPPAAAPAEDTPRIITADGGKGTKSV